MALILFGLNHNTAPLEVREKLTIAEEEYHIALASFLDFSKADCAVILSTCNRTEIFFEGDDKNLAKEWLINYKNLTDLPSDSFFYCYQDLDALSHLMRVASGMDALILGEPQILGQMKRAVALAKSVKEFGKITDKIFQTIMSAAKDIRTKTAIGENSLSIPYIITKLAKECFPDLQDRKALLIGAGETIKLCLQYLANHNIGEVFLLNRNVANALMIAQNFPNCTCSGLDKIAQFLPKADIVISATASAQFILTAQLTQEAVAHTGKIFIADLAVPRDVDPVVTNLANVTLYTVDDLKSQLEHNHIERQAAMIAAEEIIDQHILAFANWLKTLSHLDILTEYRQHIQMHRNEVLTKAQQALASGEDPKQVIERSLELLANRIMHCPTLYIKSCAATGNFTNLKLVKDIYNL